MNKKTYHNKITLKNELSINAYIHISKRTMMSGPGKKGLEAAAKLGPEALSSQVPTAASNTTPTKSPSSPININSTHSTSTTSTQQEKAPPSPPKLASNITNPKVESVLDQPGVQAAIAKQQVILQDTPFHNITDKEIGTRLPTSNSSESSIETHTTPTGTGGGFINKNMSVSKGIGTSISSKTVLTQPPNFNVQHTRSYATYSVNFSDPNTQDPLAKANNPVIPKKSGKTIQHQEYHRETCHDPNCKNTECPTLCGPVNDRKAVGHFTHGTPNTVQGTVVNVDANIDMNNQPRKQNVVAYHKAHDTIATPENKTGTAYMKDPNNPHRKQNIDQYEDKK